MKLEEILSEFGVNDAESIEKYGSGHINDTYLVITKSSKRYILQRVNDKVFKNPEEVIKNVALVCDFISEKIKALHLESEKEVLHLNRTLSGDIFVKADGFYRLYDFVENSYSRDLPQNKEEFFESAVTFGEFQYLLSDFPLEKLSETIPDFHNTEKRYADFEKSVKADSFGRANKAKEEISFAENKKYFSTLLKSSAEKFNIPLKVTHNDTKINNILFSKKTKKGLCVIDLDTVMPGYSVTDFGDSIRFGASTALEDEKDLRKVHFDFELYKTYLKGFVKGTNGSLSQAEKLLLPLGAMVMTFECGIRFLADYLSGDTYFKTDYPDHNLVRCRTQFKLLSEMEEKSDIMIEEAKKA